MKINYSLARFGNLITGLALGGILLALIGFIVIATHQGYDFDVSAIMNGVALAYLGSGLVGLAIFGAFLRITATSIIEGLGGTIETQLPEPAQPVEDAVDQGGVKLWQYLTDGEYSAWLAAGEPDLSSWDAAGRPKFKAWLANQKG
jgi:hypothetical protein